MNGGAGNDLIKGGHGNDAIDGGSGVDTVDYAGFGGNATVNLNGGGSSSGGGDNDSIVGVENIVGGNFADRLSATPGASVVHGGSGGDTIFGLGGADELFGEDGNDKLQGGDGDDILRGDDGRDSLTGGAGADQLFGGDDLDRMVGGSGDDVLVGGAGRDILRGDSIGVTGGSDLFDFNAISDSAAGRQRDIIQDFVQGEDLIDLSDIDADTASAADNAFNFIGTANFFNGVASDLRFEVSASGLHTIISGDVNGDRTPDFQVHLLGNVTLTAADFLL